MAEAGSSEEAAARTITMLSAMIQEPQVGSAWVPGRDAPRSEGPFLEEDDAQDPDSSNPRLRSGMHPLGRRCFSPDRFSSSAGYGVLATAQLLGVASSR